MNLKTRLAFLYSLSVFIILVASALLIYILNENFRKEEFIKRLELEASEAYQNFSSESEVTPELTERLQNNAANSLPEGKIYILNSAMSLIYSSDKGLPPSINSRELTLAKTKGHHHFSEGLKETMILYRRQKDKSYYIIASAVDVFGYRKSDNLKLLLVLSIVAGIIISGFLAFFYVKQAMKPLEDLKNRIKKISDENLKERITIERKNDEVWELASQFNQMLDRLEQAFEQRKNFVQHASHELRTPLANMLSHTEAALSQTLTVDEYKKTLLSLKEDQQNLIELTNSLLTLSRYEKLTAFKDWLPIRIDEVLYQTVDVINQTWPTAVVLVEFETIPEEELLVFEGNESLIRSAILNLVKNAIQYSDNYKVKIWINANETGISLKFDNEGKQLLPEERGRLFIPFFRGENSIYKKGYGLGLSIVQRIISLHKGTITYEALEGNTNRFTLFFPHTIR